MAFVPLFAQPGDVIEEPKEPEFASELDFLDWLWKQPSKPDRLRFQAAVEVARYRHATLKAVAQVREQDMATIIDAARERAAKVANVIHLKTAQKVLPPSAEHDASELKPDVSRSPGANGSGGFRRRF
jgi:hypothetical protein